MVSKEFVLLLFFAAMISLLRARRVSKTTCGSSAAFYRIAKHYVLNEEPISRNVTTDLEGCVDLCIEEPKCKAMNTHYRHDGTMDCHLLKDDHMSKPKKMIAKQGWNIYDTGSKEISRRVSLSLLFYLLNLEHSTQLKNLFLNFTPHPYFLFKNAHMLFYESLLSHMQQTNSPSCFRRYLAVYFHHRLHLSTVSIPLVITADCFVLALQSKNGY